MVYRTILLCGLLFLVACIGKSKPTRYFILSKEAKNRIEPLKPIKQPMLVLVGPLELAKYLDRTNIIQRSSANELIISNLDAWGEGLDKSIVRVISQNLSQYLPAKSLVISSWPNLASADIEIPLAIDRFDCDQTRACYLRIFWTLKQGHQTLSTLTVHEFTKLADSSSIDDQTKVLSQLLADASQVIAEEIQVHAK